MWEVKLVTNTTITNFRQNVFDYISSVVDYNDVVNITTKAGNAVVISETDYNGMMETLYISSVPGMRDKLLKSLDEPLDDMTDADELEW